MIKILLVDDDVRNASLLIQFLEVEAFEVSYAENGGIGWKRFQTIQPDLVLLDINMPGMDGFTLAEKIREVDTKVVIFFLSDRTEKNDRLRGFSLKGNDYIPKPFYPEELVAKIRERFERAQPQSYALGNTTFTPSLCQVEYRGTATTLTLRQTQILEMLATNPNTIIDRTATLQKVWGDDSPQNSLALNVQITYLRTLLKADPDITIVSLKGRGYLLRAESRE